MRALAAAILLVAGSALVAASAWRGDLDLARSRYEEAAYEDALKILEGVEASTASERVQVEQYRALCHIALGHAEQAERAVIALVDADPTYLPPHDDRLAESAGHRRRDAQPPHPRGGQKAARQRPRGVCREEHGAGRRAVLPAPEAARRTGNGGSPGARRLPHAGARLRSARRCSCADQARHRPRPRRRLRAGGATSARRAR